MMKLTFILLLSVFGYHNAQELFPKKVTTKNEDTLKGSNTKYRNFWDVKKYELSVEPDFETKSVSGTNKITFQILKNISNPTFQIDLQQPMIYKIVGSDAQEYAVEREGDFIFIKVNKKFKKGEISSFNIEFNGNPTIAKKAPWDGGWIFKKDNNGNPWISAAQEVGLPIKINAVLMKGLNDDQILPLAKWSIQQDILLRFIEFMPLDGDQKWSVADVVSEQQILAILATEFDVQIQVQPSDKFRANPARQYLINSHLTKKHTIGIISTISHSFCGDCDRIRLTAQGELYNCLFAPKGLALKTEIKALLLASRQVALSTVEKMPEKNPDKLALLQKVGAYIWKKEQGYDAIQARTVQQTSRKISMHMLGG